MTDSSEEQDKLQYVKKDLFQPVARPWHRTDADDDDSNHLFMSEPSMSEADDDDSSDHHLRLLSPMGSFTGDEEDNDNLLPPPPPPARILTTQAPASPGNTSLSSWESPHFSRRIQVHFSPDHREEERSSHVKVEKGQGRRLIMQAPANQREDGPPTPSGTRTPDRGFVSDNQQSSTSTSPESEGHRRRLEDFLHDLRVNSQGQVQESTMGANTSFESSYQGPNNRPDFLRPKHNGGIPQHQRVSSMDTAIVQNTAVSDAPLSATTQDTRVNPTDDTIVMTLSDSEDDYTKETATGGSSPSLPLDWEQQHSADDEKTADRPRRIRGKPGHRRQRSGDAAAATLSTGRTDWKGMDKDKIPLPPVPGEHDDTDNDEDDRKNNLRDEKKDAGTSNDQDPYASKMSALEGGLASSFRGNLKDAGEIAQFSKFALGTAGNDPTSPRRPFRRQHRRDSRSRKKNGVVVECEDSSSLASGGPSPRGDFSFQAPYAFHPGSLPTLSGYTAIPKPPCWDQHARMHSYPNPSPGSLHSDYTETPRSQKPDQSPQWHLSLRETGHKQYSPQFYSPKEHGLGSRRKSEGVRGTIDPMGSQSFGGSLSSTFSWLSSKPAANTEITHKDDGSEPERLPFCDNKHFEGQSEKPEDGQRSYDVFSDTSSGSSNSLERNRNMRAQSQTPTYATSPLRVLRNRTRTSPFANIGKTMEKFDRRRFLPQTSTVGEDEKSKQTYTCPVCKTCQREFFSVADAPRQFESASGYLALYFGIYVIVALYIFGLQEGWGTVDCIYFAVITLTTAGLGDFVPTTDGAKVMCSIFIYFGVACIGLLLGSYIAGMLDESSMRAARANRIKACPHCARIQDIKDAAERRRGGKASRDRAQNTVVRNLASMHRNDSDNFLSERDPKKIKRQHMNSATADRHSYSPATQIFEMSPSINDPEISPTARSHSSNGSPVGTTNNPLFNGYSPSSHLSPMAPHQAKNLMGSPLTTQILGRQSHTRHTSLDLNSGSFSAVFGQRSVSERRKFSVDLPTTIEETGGNQEKGAAPPPPKWNPERRDYEDDEPSDSEASSSSSEDTADEFDHRYSGVKNAKYVFLTLKEALVNSLVIIAFGCMGFFFIEGFSIIDSWYFTTVLLTTVGYGDIVPYTKGGKLFATIYILVAGTILLNNMSMISMIPLELRRRRTEKAVLTQFGDQLDDAALRELATGPLIERLNLSSHHPGGLDECTREMFSLAMLVRLGKVTEQDIKLTFAAFRKLDVHNDGVLNSKSIIAGMIQRRKTSALNLNRMGVQATPQQPPQPTPQQPPRQQQPDPAYSSQHNSWSNGYGNWFNGSEDTQGIPPHEQSSLFAGQSSYNSIGVQRSRVVGTGNTSE